MDRVELEALVIARRLRVPVEPAPQGPGDDVPASEAAARQLDAALLSTGFCCSKRLLDRLSSLPVGAVLDLGVRVLAAVRRLVGDHVEHNVYFRDFPENVPDTLEFWTERLTEALLDPDPETAGKVVDLDAGTVNLLALPGYGRYQHSYQEMLAAHDELVASAGDRVTMLELGADLSTEAAEWYVGLAGSEVPLSEEDLAVLRDLSVPCADGPQPERIPVRENRAVVNSARLGAGRPLLVDTVTDVLRLACGLSGGDVTLEGPTKFRSFARTERRALLRALDDVVSTAPGKLGDVGRFAERWKRLGERLHPHEYSQFPHAAMVFEVARGERRAASFDARVEAAFGRGQVGRIVDLLEGAPGLLLRRLDHLLRTVDGTDDAAAVMDATAKAARQASGRVLLGLREHLQNRSAPVAAGRVFVNRQGRAWVRADDREPLRQEVLTDLMSLLDEEISGRLPDLPGRLLTDPAVLDAALPLSGKAVAPGLGMLPRGSLSVVEGTTLRFFVHWRQAERRTDYDLSALMLDEQYDNPEYVSWTRYKTGFATYSGDLTEARDGATEFVDVRLDKATHPLVIPQVHIYSGEPFDEAAEAFFGYMTRERKRRGRPFEPRTVRAKSDLRGSGRVAIPLIFYRGADDVWRAKWLHIYLRGWPQFNMVEGNRLTTARLVRSIVEREYLTVRYLVGLMTAAGDTTDEARPEGRAGESGPVTYIGLEAPHDLPEGSRAYTLNTLADLIPS